MAKIRRYALSKRANILFSSELQRRMNEEGTNITCLSLHPGLVKTPGADKVMPLAVRPLVWLFFAKPEKAVLTTMFAATARQIREDGEHWKGKYLVCPGLCREPSRAARDVEAARNLWVTTEAALRATGVLDT